MILVLKTAGPTSEMWLLAATGAPNPAPAPAAHLTWDSGRTLADHLLSRIYNFLAEHQAEIKHLSGIAIFSGPGSFTSLRIGHATANALADSLTIPIVGAHGDDWLETARRALATAKPGHPAWPHYGAEAHITKPGA